MRPPAQSIVPWAEELIPAGQMEIWMSEGVEGYLLREWRYQRHLGMRWLGVRVEDSKARSDDSRE
jgi:hypothetical protein